MSIETHSKFCVITSIASNMVLLEPTIIIVFAGNLILNLVNYSECHQGCDIWSRSTCTDNVTTKWNKQYVGESLKNWVTSISKIRSITEKENESIFLSKTVLAFETKNNNGDKTGKGVFYISNSDCIKQRNIGPKWRKASRFSNTQFGDGFIYSSNEDDNGVFTGLFWYTMENIHIISEVVNFW